MNSFLLRSQSTLKTVVLSRIDGGVPGALMTERFIGQVRDDAATRMFFQSRLTVGDVYMLLGPPDRSWFRAGNPALPLSPIHAVYYEAYGLQLSSASRCPLRLDHLWRKPAELSFLIVPSQFLLSDDSAPIFPMDGASWRRTSLVC